MLIDDRGTSMPLEQAITHVVFKPFIPAAQILGYAVLPPLGDLDTDAHRGLGIEYVSNNGAMLLSQWPKQDFVIAFAHSLGQDRTLHARALQGRRCGLDYLVERGDDAATRWERHAGGSRRRGAALDRAGACR